MMTRMLAETTNVQEFLHVLHDCVINKYINEHFITFLLRLEFGNCPVQLYKIASTHFQISTVLFVCFGQL
jgi:hypothetical protein